MASKVESYVESIPKAFYTACTRLLFGWVPARAGQAWVRQIPNWLTAVRLLAPLTIWGLLANQHQPLLWLALYSGLWLTDFLDGGVARMIEAAGHQRSKTWGETFDPIIDKLSVIAGFVGITGWVGWSWWLVPAFAVMASLDIYGTLINLPTRRAGGSGGASSAGKFKLNLQVGLVMTLLWGHWFLPRFDALWRGITLPLAALALWKAGASLYHYRRNVDC